MVPPFAIRDGPRVFQPHPAATIRCALHEAAAARTMRPCSAAPGLPGLLAEVGLPTSLAERVVLTGEDAR